MSDAIENNGTRSETPTPSRVVKMSPSNPRVIFNNIIQNFHEILTEEDAKKGRKIKSLSIYVSRLLPLYCPSGYKRSAPDTIACVIWRMHSELQVKSSAAKTIKVVSKYVNELRHHHNIKCFMEEVSTK